MTTTEFLPGFALRRATSADAALLANFAERTFRETFAPDNRAEDLDAYCAGAYGEPQQRNELDDPASAIWLVEHDGVLAAFAHAYDGPPPPCVPAGRTLEVKRFYVDAPFHGRGLAPRLMAVVLDDAVVRGFDALWLGVWEKNPRAIAYYRKQGFDYAGVHDFVLGSDVQQDLILVRSLS